MVLSKKQMWDKYHKEASKEENPDSYINSRGLEIIKNAEGHNSYDPKTKTTYYGITQAGIDGLEALQRVYKTRIPEWIRDAKVETITEAQARTLTKYNAMLNTKLIEDFSSSPNFTNLSLDTKSAFLTYFHNVSPYSMRRSFAENKPGSFLRAVRIGNPYLMGRALISRGDGSSLGDIDDGYKRRAMIAIMAVGNKNFTFTAQQERDMDIRFKLPKFGDEAHARLGELADDWMTYRKVSEGSFDWLASNTKNNRNEIQSQPPATMPQQATQDAPAPMRQNRNLDSLLTNLTNTIKNLFTNSEENQNVAQRNQDINLQPGPSIARGGTNQLSERPDDQSSQSV